MSRMTFNQYFMSIAKLAAQRSTCRRRKVGCVLVNQDNYIISTGYNGVPKKVTHCIDNACEGVESESGTNLDSCLALHAETNAIAHCNNISSLNAIYITCSPCMSCAKLISATNCKSVYYGQPYAGIEIIDKYFKACGINLVRVS